MNTYRSEVTFATALRHFVVALITVVVLLQGVGVATFLVNLPSDLSLFLGVLLGGGTFIGCVWFVQWYVRREILGQRVTSRNE